jgi:hypothetical protein
MANDLLAMGLAALISATASFAFALSVLVLDLAGVLRRRPGRRVMLTGLLVMNGAALARMIAQEGAGHTGGFLRWIRSRWR